MPVLELELYAAYNVYIFAPGFCNEMVQKRLPDNEFPHSRAQRLFHPVEAPSVDFPIQSVRIDWDRLVAKCPTVLETVNAMPTYRLILDLMWTTGARISEVLALSPSSFVDDGYDFGVILAKTWSAQSSEPSALA
ncbi:hypothetical protein [Gynuella sp.]|uniref:hypothetical protein n=1 Tax=Gynuella sp. TaxID=2969146 RepID=UPI003D0F2B42